MRVSSLTEAHKDRLWRFWRNVGETDAHTFQPRHSKVTHMEEDRVVWGHLAIANRRQDMTPVGWADLHSIYLKYTSFQSKPFTRRSSRGQAQMPRPCHPPPPTMHDTEPISISDDDFDGGRVCGGPGSPAPLVALAWRCLGTATLSGGCVVGPQRLESSTRCYFEKLRRVVTSRLLHRHVDCPPQPPPPCESNTKVPKILPPGALTNGLVVRSVRKHKR